MDENDHLDDPTLLGDLLGDMRDSTGLGGWLDSYMDEVMVTNNIQAPATPSFAPPMHGGVGVLNPLSGLAYNMDFVPRVTIVTGGPRGALFGGDPGAVGFSGQGLSLEPVDRSGSTNSNESRQDIADGDGGGTNKSASKALAVAEKNRKAQKRFRERQKSKMLDSAKQVEELTAKLAAVMHEKNKLESRNNVLEKVVKLKEEQIAAMESRGLDPEPVKMTSDGTPIAQDDLWDILWTFSKVVQRGKPERDKDDKRPIPLSHLQQKHKEWVEEVAMSLMDGAEDPSTPAHSRMNDLVAVMREATTRMGLMNDRLMMTLCASTIIPDPTAQIPDATYWRKVLDVTNLSKQQKVKIREVHHELLVRMEHVLKERELILVTLQERRTSGDLQELRSLDQAGAFLEKRSGLEALQKNLKAEYRVVFDFELAFYHDILLPLQHARMAVQSYPWPTDTLALCQLIVEEIGDFPVEEGGLLAPNPSTLLSKVTANSPFLSLAGMRTPAHPPLPA